MKPPIYVLDTHALMAYLRRELGYETVREVLRERVSLRATILLSEINWGEAYYMTAKKDGQQRADRSLRYIEQLGIVVEPIDRALVKAAADLKIQYSTSKSRISYADCFAAALTQRHGGILLTGDPEFKSLESIISIRWLRP